MKVWYVEVHQHSFLHRHLHSLFVTIITISCASDVSRLMKDVLYSSETSLPVLSYYTSASLH